MFKNSSFEVFFFRVYFVLVLTLLRCYTKNDSFDEKTLFPAISSSTFQLVLALLRCFIEKNRFDEKVLFAA